MKAPRIEVIDAVRGAAVIAMIGYHTTWDLWSFRLISVDLLNDWVWLAARTAILSTFLVISGITLVLSTAGAINWRRFGRRLAILVVAAAAVSAVSMGVFPDAPIFFGVLHLMAASSLLALPLRSVPAWITAVGGILVFVASYLGGLPVFDHPALQWVGLMTYPPDSNDYTPLIPWFGVFMIGVAVGRWRLGRVPLSQWTPKTWASWGVTWIGRWSLPVYVIHQPIIYGAMWAVVTLTTPTIPPAAQSFLDSCSSSCQTSGLTVDRCQRYCACALDKIAPENLLDSIADGHLTADQNLRVQAIARACFTAP